MRVEIWSDVVCPWCYIGKRQFEKALQGFEHRDRVEVVHRSFQLDPTLPPGETVDVAEMLAEKYGMTRERAVEMNRQMEERAAGVGLEYHLEGGRAGNTLDAHRIVHLAAKRGRQDEVVEALYKAHFTDRRSVFDHDSLVEIAAAAGLDADEARETLASGAFTAEVEADQREAAALGATGVPFFVLDRRYGVSGAQPPEAFTEALNRAWTDANPALTTIGGDAEACTDDTCAVPQHQH
ncbi:Predicted dithiol-disulfide isomerase, DsbA family [Actinomadura meyerae]|uniref:Predicted dithiol-disulfide isomerase, DsbA family n=1 Tax=Actinomadura meyerae TaxID=240840 RepID=A0A239N5A7_9ACTN|nr:DsbA family oxidoreductase [Actinomadura meyerae]SNT50106.1 Predicted dithiol-disulfide isomerase, DsbA family [Actinomadura meyerae]